MYHIHGKSIDTIVTPNHRFLVEDRNGKSLYITAKELFDTKKGKLKIPKKESGLVNTVKLSLLKV